MTPIRATITAAAPIIGHGARRESVSVSGPLRVRDAGDVGLSELFTARAFLGTDGAHPHKYYES